jgi:hypothetical protein
VELIADFSTHVKRVIAPNSHAALYQIPVKESISSGWFSLGSWGRKHVEDLVYPVFAGDAGIVLGGRYELAFSRTRIEPTLCLATKARSDRSLTSATKEARAAVAMPRRQNSRPIQ